MPVTYSDLCCWRLSGNRLLTSLLSSKPVSPRGPSKTISSGSSVARGHAANAPGRRRKKARRDMNTLKFVAIVGALSFVAACSTDLDKSRTAEPTGGNAFTQALTKEYKDLA